jgi:ribosomal protein L37AE/L43A
MNKKCRNQLKFIIFICNKYIEKKGKKPMERIWKCPNCEYSSKRRGNYLRHFTPLKI